MTERSPSSSWPPDRPPSSFRLGGVGLPFLYTGPASAGRPTLYLLFKLFEGVTGRLELIPITLAKVAKD